MSWEATWIRWAAYTQTSYAVRAVQCIFCWHISFIEILLDHFPPSFFEDLWGFEESTQRVAEANVSAEDALGQRKGIQQEQRNLKRNHLKRRGVKTCGQLELFVNCCYSAECEKVLKEDWRLTVKNWSRPRARLETATPPRPLNCASTSQGRHCFTPLNISNLLQVSICNLKSWIWANRTLFS